MLAHLINFIMTKTGILILFLIIALYFGIGGLIILENDLKYEKAKTLEKKEVYYNNKIKFHNKEVMNAAIQQDHILKIYPYAKQLPSAMSFIITALSFGMIGSIGKVINDSIKNKVRLSETINLLLIPLQGSIIGLIILGISYVIPLLLTSDDVSLKPITIVFLCLFGGIFYLDFYNWLEEIFKKMIFKNPDVE